MKHSILIFVCGIAATLLSCSKVQDPVTDVAPVISFMPHVESKSYITDATDVNFRKGFAVFANKTERNDPSKSAEIMTNYKVWYNAGQWVYTPFADQHDVWWGLNCDHRFLAIYPWDNAATTYAFVQDVAHISKISTVDCDEQIVPPVGPNIGNDIMYARHKQYYKLGDVPAPVVLNFKHCLSAFSVKVRNASGSNIAYIDNISLEGLMTQATDLKIDRRTDEDPTMTMNTDSRGTYQFPKSPGSESNPWIAATNDTFQQLVTPAIILPQNFLKQDVWLRLIIKFQNDANLKSLDYKISTIPLAGPVKDQYDYLPGKHYIYKIDILSNHINCSVEVKDWVNDPAIELK